MQPPSPIDPTLNPVEPRNEKKQLPGRQLVRGQSYKAIITSIRRFAASDTFGPFN